MSSNNALSRSVGDGDHSFHGFPDANAGWYWSLSFRTDLDAVSWKLQAIS